MTLILILGAMWLAGMAAFIAICLIAQRGEKVITLDDLPPVLASDGSDERAGAPLDSAVYAGLTLLHGDAGALGSSDGAVVALPVVGGAQVGAGAGGEDEGGESDGGDGELETDLVEHAPAAGAPAA
jgi:hypothetical protein